MSDSTAKSEEEHTPPRAFMSYCWDNEVTALTLAEELRENGIDVILDKWHLKEGQDLNKFMEAHCVGESSADFILVLCSPEYTSKANKREGGVGKETLILAPDVYENANQEHVLPIIIARDELGNVCRPIYLRDRFYFDLSDQTTYGTEFAKLVMRLYGQQVHTPPKLGKPPAYILHPEQHSISLSAPILQLKGATGTRAKRTALGEFGEELSKALRELGQSTVPANQRSTGEKVFTEWEKTLSMRKAFTDLLRFLMLMEHVYNDALTPYPAQWKSEVIRIFMWELFILSVAFLKSYKDYDVLTSLLTYPYTHKSGYTQSHVESFCMFYMRSQLLEDEYRLDYVMDENNPKVRPAYMAAYEMCIHRAANDTAWESKQRIAQADTFLYQIATAQLAARTGAEEQRGGWYPMCYRYLADEQELDWPRLVSKKHCLKLLTLFGCESIEQLRDVIRRCVALPYEGYPYLDRPPIISEAIPVERIGTQA